MATGTIHKTIRLLSTALDELDAHLKTREIERIGFLVHEAMSVQGRSFHTPEHIFDLVAPNDPYATLAALFHDIVYYNVDQGFTPEIEWLLTPYLEIRGGSVRLVSSISSDDRAFHGCAAVFGMRPGDTLSPYAGLNEFLSALVMTILLTGAVSDEDLLIPTACIEATIPFRKRDDGGVSPPEHLAKRLHAAVHRFGLSLSEEDVEQSVERAVRFANRDVWNFREEDVGRFLDNTWKLLPETNPSLRTGGVYTVTSYRTALQKMEGFMTSLDPTTIFARYGDAPPRELYDRNLELASRNVAVGARYLAIKLLTAGILEAVAKLSGGDAPVAYLMGSIAVVGPGERMTEFLPKEPDERAGDIDPVIDDLLAKGRASASGFDMQNSPLSLFVYKRLGDSDVADRMADARRMFADEIDARQFVSTLPEPMVRAICLAIGEIAFTRKDTLSVLIPE